MVLAGFVYPTGYHVGAWRHPDVPAGGGVDIDFASMVAARCEQEALDFLFLADGLGFKGSDIDILSRTALRYVCQFEPLTLLSALAATTSRIGLVASASTTYSEPFTLARQFASLDQLSRGRAGWNLVTGQNPHEAANYGAVAHPDHATRYRRATEFADVVLGLWDSWGDGAFCRDKAAGRFFRPEEMRRLDHIGEFFSVRGPLSVPRSPQGRPVMAQAGSSERGRDLAARTADIVFTAQDDIDAAVRFRADVRDRARRAGRDPDALRVLVGMVPYVGRALADAEQRLDDLEELVEDEVALSLLSTELGGVDLTGVDPAGPLPPVPETERSRSRRALIVASAEREELTVREIALRVASSRGHLRVVADATGAADTLEHWYRVGACDGFIVMAPAMPWGMTDFFDHVLPLLRERGLAKHRYESTTLREHLGLEPV